MSNVLVLGAAGSIARVAIDLFILDPYRDSARVIEESDVAYTILRPGWFTDAAEVAYEITRKGEPFRGHDVSRRSVASLVVKLALDPEREVRESLGISQPSERE